jgi:2-polyprenyl-6-methoxyphenol hydroxylase-like FAD-dependent oxidoreductase
VSNGAKEGQRPPGKLVRAALFCLAIAILNTAAGTSPCDSFTRSHSTFQVSAEFILGADGVYSAVRGQLLKQERFNYRQV